MLTVEEREREKEFIENPDRWPYWPALPIKAPPWRTAASDDPLPETGWITADFPTVVLKERPTVKGIIMQLRFELPDDELTELGFFDPRKLIPGSAKEFYEAQIVRRYEDLDGLLDDWIVD